MRDYIHVDDLAAGHIAALAPLGRRRARSRRGTSAPGTARRCWSCSHAFERACGHELPYEVVDRRPGDVAASYADPSRAEAELGWRATRTVDDMCVDTWRWQRRNPHGYPGA